MGKNSMSEMKKNTKKPTETPDNRTRADAPQATQTADTCDTTPGSAPTWKKSQKLAACYPFPTFLEGSKSECENTAKQVQHCPKG